jgi:hypothetical protein
MIRECAAVLSLCSLAAACAAERSAGRGKHPESSAGTVQVGTSLEVWQAGVLAEIGRHLVTGTGRVKTALLGIALGSSTSSFPPEVYVLRRIASEASGLVEQPSRIDRPPGEPGGPLTAVTVFYEMPEHGAAWALEQFALWFDPAAMDSATDPVFAGILDRAPAQVWRIVSAPDPATGTYQDSLVSALEGTVAAFRFPAVRVGFAENLPGGRVAIRFADAPPANGVPVDYEERTFAGWDEASGSTVPIAAVQLRNNVTSGAGGLWVLVSDTVAGSPFAAVLCFPESLPDDCERAASGEAVLHPLSEVFP